MPVLELAFASGESSLSVRRFRVREEVSDGFTAAVWARSPDPSLDLGSLVGKPASLRVEAGYAFALLGGARLWQGVCSAMEQVRAEPTGLSTYHLRIVPSLWLLGKRRNHRIFQHLSVPDIADLLLGEWGVEHAWKIDRPSYPKLEFRVQYGESDLDFLSRLLEEAGIAFTFPDEGGSGTKLTLGDKLHEAPVRAAPPVPYVDNPNQAAERELVTRVRLAHEVRPGAYAVRDHDFRKPGYALFGKAPPAPSPEDRLEQYRYAPGAFLVEGERGGDTPTADDQGVARHDQQAGNARADRALAGERAGKRAVTFETNVLDLWPGVVFVIDGHDHPEVDGQKLLVTGFSVDGEAGREWTMKGLALPAADPYRPPLVTPRPQIHSMQSATVVGPAGQEIHTDEFGRVRVQLPWDREGRSDDRSSCWMRVSQGWAGSAYGMMHIPRIGQEVLVAFVDDNPDQPVVVGRLYNQAEPVPHRLPDDKTKSTWKSDSSPRTGGFNELMFEDRKGDELVSAQAEKNRRALVKNDATLTVGHDRTKQVGVDETDTTGHDRTEVTSANRSQDVGADRTTVIGGDRARLTRGNEDERTEGDHLLTVAGDRHVLVEGEKRELVEIDSHVHVKGNRNEQVDGTRSLGTSSLQVKVGKKAGIEAGDEIHLVTPKVMVGEAAADLTLSGPGGFLRIDASGVTIVGTLVRINVGGSAGSGAGAHPAKPAQPTSAPVGAPAAITSQTVASGSTNRSRTRVGVGEEVTLTYSTGAASWTVSGGGTVTPASGNTTTFRAGERTGTATITANGSDGATTITIQVVEPTDFVMEQAPGTNIKHTTGRPDCGFLARIYLQPSDVSFENIEVREQNSNSTASGFYAPFNNLTHQPAGQVASAWFTVNAPAGGKGSSPNLNDQIYSGDPGGGPPWTAGSMTFPITWEFRVRGGAVKALPGKQQSHQVDAGTGKCTSSKAGESKSRVPSDPTSSW